MEVEKICVKIIDKSFIRRIIVIIEVRIVEKVFVV